MIELEPGVLELDFLDGAERQFGDLPFYVAVTPETASPERGTASGGDEESVACKVKAKRLSPDAPALADECSAKL